jgi:endonuclease YncB( thermonuclease family)
MENGSLKNNLKLVTALLAVVVSANPVMSQPLTATVTKVIDGDTIVIDNSYKVRLACIDAPESKQEWGPESTEFLSEYVLGQTVQVDLNKKKDKYGRYIGLVSLNGQNVNLASVLGGFSFAYYLKDCPIRDQVSIAQETAKDFRLGVWAIPSMVYPWDFRKK